MSGRPPPTYRSWARAVVQRRTFNGIAFALGSGGGFSSASHLGMKGGCAIAAL
jgi:hypothetical protein